MKVKSKFAALASIKKVQNPSKGSMYELWQADCGTFRGKRIRISRATKADCTRAVENWYNTRLQCGESIVYLTPVQISEAVMCYDALKEAGKPLRLLPIVQEYILSSKKETPQKAVLDAYNEYFDSFSDLQVATRLNVKKRVGDFVSKFQGKNVSEITANDIISHLSTLKGHDGGECAPKTWNMAMTEIRTFFNWCCKKVRGYCTENPIADLEKKPEPNKIPEFATVEDVRKLFRALKDNTGAMRDLLLYRFTLSYFLGIRSEEIFRIGLSDVRLDGESILIRQPKGHQKGTAHRVVPINQTAMAWMKEIDMVKLASEIDVAPNSILRYATIIKEESGAKIPHNGGRHSFATYHVAAYGDITKTATILGNSPSIIRSNYQGLVEKREGEAYFSILPCNV